MKTREFLFALMSCISILYEEYSIIPYKNSLHSCHAKITAVFADVDYDVGSFPSTSKAVDVYYMKSFPFKPHRWQNTHVKCTTWCNILQKSKPVCSTLCCPHCSELSTTLKNVDSKKLKCCFNYLMRFK